ncbi:MAG: hypothetical protein ACI4VE_00735 [Clostridia bacterium]
MYNNISEIDVIPYNKITVENDNFVNSKQIVNKLLADGWVILDVSNGYFVLGKPSQT